MQLHTGAEHFGNVIFRYSELPSQYHIDASIDVYHTWRARDKTIDVTRRNSRRREQFWMVNRDNSYSFQNR